MEPYILKMETDTPEIVLDSEKKQFSIVGRSIPENAVSFYKPVLEWLEEYAKTTKGDIEFKFSFDYFNTASAKQIAKIMLVLEKMSKTNKVKVKWFYKKNDTDMQTDGIRYQELTDIDIDIVEDID